MFRFFSFWSAGTVRHYAYLKPCFDPLYFWVSFWNLQDMSEWKLTTRIRFAAAALCHFNKVLFYCKRCLPAITSVSFPCKTFGGRMPPNCVTFEQSPNHKTEPFLSFHAIGSLHAFLVSPKELPWESWCRQTDFFQSFNSLLLTKGWWEQARSPVAFNSIPNSSTDGSTKLSTYLSSDQRPYKWP